MLGELEESIIASLDPLVTSELVVFFCVIEVEEFSCFNSLAGLTTEISLESTYTTGVSSGVNSLISFS